MSTVNESNNINNNQNALKSLTMFILIFVILKAVAVLLYFFQPFYSDIVYVVGTIVLIIGIYSVSKKNNELGDGLKVSILLIMAMILDFITGFLINTTPPTLNNTGTFMDQLGQLDFYFGNNAYFIAAFALFTGVFMALAAYFFNSWFNDNLNSSKPVNLYVYFGVLFCAGELISFVGYVVLRRASKQILATWTGADPQSIAFSNGLILLGSLVIVIAFIIEILAALQMFTLINKSGNKTSA